MASSHPAKSPKSHVSFDVRSEPVTRKSVLPQQNCFSQLCVFTDPTPAIGGRYGKIMRVVSHLPTPAWAIMGARLLCLSRHRASRPRYTGAHIHNLGRLRANSPASTGGQSCCPARDRSRSNARQGPFSPPLPRHFHHKYENNDGFEWRPDAADNVDNRA